jgi:hypothetical protein
VESDGARRDRERRRQSRDTRDALALADAFLQEAREEEERQQEAWEADRARRRARIANDRAEEFFNMLTAAREREGRS